MNKNFNRVVVDVIAPESKINYDSHSEEKVSTDTESEIDTESKRYSPAPSMFLVRRSPDRSQFILKNDLLAPSLGGLGT